MASIRREIQVDAPAEGIWAAIRDVGAVHTRLAPGFVIDTRLEDGARIVTFSNGLVARELIVDIDEEAARSVAEEAGPEARTFVVRTDLTRVDDLPSHFTNDYTGLVSQILGEYGLDPFT